ncbi:MAG: type II secretion system protein [Candidatus Dojkabacteria bacterium]
MNRRYSAFTLVEMLIVMGILIILMAVGITAGRFAINRANDVAHQNAADQLYTAMQAYYTDEREFPDNSAESWTFGDALATGGDLSEYMGDGEFTGGTDATFYYWRSAGDAGSATAEGQAILVCVSLGGLLDESARGFYCTGNGFGSEVSGIDDKNVPNPDGSLEAPGFTGTGTTTQQNWETKAWK